MRINVVWHLKNKMPKNPNTKQRIKWHLEHVRVCGCRPIPERLMIEAKKLLRK